MSRGASDRRWRGAFLKLHRYDLQRRMREQIARQRIIRQVMVSLVDDLILES
jgi:hypothetical protein